MFAYNTSPKKNYPRTVKLSIADYSDSIRAIFGISCGHHKLQFSVLKTAFSGMHVMSGSNRKIKLEYCEMVNVWYTQNVIQFIEFGQHYSRKRRHLALIFAFVF